MFPVYYIPGRKTAHDDLLREVGLDFGPGYSHTELVGGGPDQAAGVPGRGVLIHWPSPIAPHATPNVGMQASWQWAKAKPDPEQGLPAGRFWMARMPGCPITPEGVSRRERYPGTDVRLDDGNLWHVPIPRALPHELTLNAQGQWTRQIREPFVEYYNVVLRFMSSLLERGSPLRKDLHIADAFRLAEMALALNYRLNRHVIDWLGLLKDEEALFRVACAATEIHAFVAIDEQKKTEECIPAI